MPKFQVADWNWAMGSRAKQCSITSGCAEGEAFPAVPAKQGQLS